MKTMPTNPHTTHTDASGRPFRVMGIKRIPGTEKWVDRALKCHWGVLIKFLDEQKPDKKVLYYGWDDKLYKKK